VGSPTSRHPWPGPSASSSVWAAGYGIRYRRRCSWCTGYPGRRRRIVPSHCYALTRRWSRSLADYSPSSRDKLRCVMVSHVFKQSTEVPRPVSRSIYRRPHPTSILLSIPQGTRKHGLHLLSHALLARCRLNEGWPGGTDCDVADGLSVVSMYSSTARHCTYGVPMLGCAASGCGAAGPELAIKECSPDMLSWLFRAIVGG
jgi:hypothetical protein